MDEAPPLFRKVDCIRVPVASLDAGLAFYRDGLGLALRWRTETAAGLAMPETEAEFVIHTEGRPPEVDLLVDDAGAAAARVVASGGRVIAGPFDIPVGRCVVTADPWGNALVMLDLSKGRYATDADGNVTDVA
jgi:predicted enzyme related to lactoylglutathione lyase